MQESTSPQTEGSLNTQLLKAAAALDLAQVTDLLAKGADAKFLDDPPGVWGSRNSKTALHLAMQALANSKEQKDGVAVVHVLLDAGADVNAEREHSDWRGCGRTQTAFEMLLANGSLQKDPSLLEIFLAKGANPNAEQKSSTHSMRTDGYTSNTPLHTAVRRNDVNAAGVLLRAGAEVNHPYLCTMHNERGFNQDERHTPLHLAVKGGHLEMLLLLLAEGANPNEMSKHLHHAENDEESPTDDPREDGYISPVVCVPVTESALHMALLAERADMACALLAAGADRDAVRCFGDEKQSVAQLAGDDAELMEALQTTSGWTPENHRYFAAGLRDQVRTVLLVAKAKGWQLPEDALFKIFSAVTSAPALSKTHAATKLDTATPIEPPSDEGKGTSEAA